MSDSPGMLSDGTKQDSMTDGGHVPVMLAEVLAVLAPRDGAAYLDGTFGGGGYSAAILSAASCTLYAVDRDPDAIARGAALAARFPGRLHLIEGRFGDMLDLLAARGVTALDGVVLDLGISSYQIDQPERGFSLRADGPLDMRMEKVGPTAAELVNTLPERELADLLWELGEERHSRRIARKLVAARAEAPFETTLQLAETIHSVMPRDPSGMDSATRSFQALRLRVNDELGEVERGLAAAARLLAPGGRLVVVSFHSLEDRIVKRFMRDAAGRAPGASRHDPASLANATGSAEFRLLTNSALRPSPAESKTNPRARSARLRAIERLQAA
jgi:16S rRNA (cytosine1402-N4)-methyltransferase